MTSSKHISLHERSVEILGRQIVSGKISPGSALDTEHLGGSRSVLRESIRVLESLGLVKAQRKVGTVVLPESEWNILDPRVISWRFSGQDKMRQFRYLSELRLAIEPVAAKLASSRATPEQHGALTAAIVGMASTQRLANREEYLSHDRDFHRILLEASGNPAFLALSTAVLEVLSGRTTHELMPSVANPEAIRLHELVVSCVRRGDGDGAEQAMRSIVVETDHAIQDQMQPSD